MIDVSSLFPLGVAHYLLGGFLIGVGISLIYLKTGIIAGASTFFTSTLSYISNCSFLQQKKYLESRNWRLLFALSIVLGAGLYSITHNTSFITALSWKRLLLAGVLVGFGTRMSGGCTSGHGICGLASLSKESLINVAVFFIVAIIVAHLTAGLTGVVG
ncbi:YeeE/YedE family protein [Candidatus Woesearchaeota archaeon]|nr:MAG: YeeE/YedE family protein [Candidatus Woesearchaeota archaeon]